MPDTSQEIKRAHESLARLEKIESVLKQMRIEKERLEKRVACLKLALAKENFDVYKIEGKSFSTLLYSILGTLEERTEKERREALSARLKLEQAEGDLNDLDEQITQLESERALYLRCKDDLTELIENRKKQLLDCTCKTAILLFELEDKLNTAKTQNKEIEEAILAGRNVLTYINSALSKLKEAQGWSVADMLGYVRPISDAMKHTHILKAALNVEKAQRLLLRFKAELSDINIKPYINKRINIDTDSYPFMADVVFDGIYVDWHVQERIVQSYTSVLLVRNQVSDTVKKLEQLRRETNKQIKSLEEEIANTVAAS